MEFCCAASSRAYQFYFDWHYTGKELLHIFGMKMMAGWKKLWVPNGCRCERQISVLTLKIWNRILWLKYSKVFHRYNSKSGWNVILNNQLELHFQQVKAVFHLVQCLSSIFLPSNPYVLWNKYFGFSEISFWQRWLCQYFLFIWPQFGIPGGILAMEALIS